jgi:hypothetical protein
MDLRKRFYVAMGIYAALGLVIWFAMDNVALPVNGSGWAGDVHITVKQLTLAIWAMFVARTVLHRRAEQIRAEREQQEQSEAAN